MIHADIEQLRQGIAEIDDYLQDPPTEKKLPGDKFIPVMTNFLLPAKKQLGELQKRMAETEKTYKSTLTLFGEEPTSDYDEFFGSLHRFVVNFDVRVL